MLNTKQLERLVARMLALHEAVPTSYDRQEIERLIRWDPELFTRFHRRASSTPYLKGQPITHSLRLWIALNLLRNVEASPRCYFCDESYTRSDVLAGRVHLEHFFARSAGGDHHPANITLACGRCNRLKSDLQAIDFDRMLGEPNQFFDEETRFRSQRKRLIAFAEISAPHYKGLNWIGERFGVSSMEWRKTWDSLRAAYRRDWHQPETPPSQRKTGALHPRP